MPVRRDNPYSNFNFVVEIDGVDAGSFSEVELPQGEIEVIEYREGADPSLGRAQAPRAGQVHERRPQARDRRANGALRVVEVGARRRHRPPEHRDRSARRGSRSRAALALAASVADEALLQPPTRARQRGRDRVARARARGLRDRLGVTAAAPAAQPTAAPAAARRSSGSDCASRGRRPTSGRGRVCRRS